MREIPLGLRCVVEAYATSLRARFGERLVDVRLFGSYARGDAHEDSDVDVLVLIDRLTARERSEAAAMAGIATWDSGFCVSGLPMATAHFEALRAGERLLARTVDAEGVSL